MDDTFYGRGLLATDAISLHWCQADTPLPRTMYHSQFAHTPTAFHIFMTKLLLPEPLSALSFFL
ncbi:hypothetical protein HOLleu_39733 [Holothuria leucospilota]|uniref:Uncharacterized protein n=1 Tax=Holothuria leucospilota TaxID=206669 RepID=A0A9Q0YK60_HOLLE|nr:hypothetical protein HOLleu_39733 [Holothuria leucospilota]